MQNTGKINNWLTIGIWLLIALIPASAIGATSIKPEKTATKPAHKTDKQDSEKEVVLAPTFEAVISVSTVWILIVSFYFLNLQRPVAFLLKSFYSVTLPFNHAFFSKIFCKLIVIKAP
ncbi:MAG TPA: hypothetical protein DCM08_14065 [Microscillaceae bacterium]|jgi:beta-lactamase regulating signal transducer with metallopeptidase domain|nr:hypothetical protein [Microscillaceae bacterium]